MNLSKLKILVEKSANPLSFDEANPITALFNPNQFLISKKVNWQDRPTKERDTPAASFTFGSPATLTLDLMFDTYETLSDVRDYSDRVSDLTTVARHGDIHRPPICQLTWGRQGVFFQGVLTSLDTRFTLFLADGTPVRATLNCSVRRWISDEDEDKQQNRQSAAVAKKRIVKRGDSLSSIAAEEFHDATLWRPIAEANKIDDPRALAPGMTLTIPVLITQKKRS